MLILECTQTIGQVPWGLRSARTNKSGVDWYCILQWHDKMGRISSRTDRSYCHTFAFRSFPLYLNFFCTHENIVKENKHIAQNPQLSPAFIITSELLDDFNRHGLYSAGSHSYQFCVMLMTGYGSMCVMFVYVGGNSCGSLLSYSDKEGFGLDREEG